VTQHETREFFVTVVDGPRYGFLLGPYATHEEALGQVDRGRKLANDSNDRVRQTDAEKCDRAR
jgi:hypothetical protein